MYVKIVFNMFGYKLDDQKRVLNNFYIKFASNF